MPTMFKDRGVLFELNTSTIENVYTAAADLADSICRICGNKHLQIT